VHDAGGFAIGQSIAIGQPIPDGGRDGGGVTVA
jgi:hypothetical protein